MKIDSPLLLASDDAVWSEWLRYHERDSADYRMVLTLFENPGIRRSLRARALLLALFTGQEYRSLSPIEMPNDLSSWCSEKLNLGSIEIDFARLAAQAICGVVDAGYLDWSVLTRLRQLLCALSTEEAEEVFRRYPLNDPKPFCSMDDSSGYNPFVQLLQDERVPKIWKCRADVVMCEIVLAEIEGRAKPRVEWEEAPLCYTRAVTIQFYAGRHYYHLDLWADQLLFIAENIPKCGRDLHYDKIVSYFPEPKYTRLRHQVARSVFVDGDRDVVVWMASQVAAIKSLFAEFGPYDALLSSALTTALRAGCERLEKEAVEKARVRSQIDALTEKMR